MIAGAVDFGPQMLHVGLVDESGAILARKAMPTPNEPAEAAAALLAELKGGRELAGVGATGAVPAGFPAIAENAVNALALAERRFGAARGVANLLWVDISAGIEAALIVDGRLYRGAHGIAGQIGHIVVTEHGPACGCGHKGCVASVASGPAIARRARGAGLDVPDVASVFAQARQGNSLASWMVTEAGKYLGRAFSVCFNLFDPELLVVGGEVAEGLDLLLPYIEKTMSVRAVCRPEHPPRIAATGLTAADAPLLGAAALVL